MPDKRKEEDQIKKQKMAEGVGRQGGPTAKRKKK